MLMKNVLTLLKNLKGDFAENDRGPLQHSGIVIKKTFKL